MLCDLLKSVCCGQNTDSEEEVPSVKKSKKPPEKKADVSKPGKVQKRDPVVYISETGNGRHISLYVQLQWGGLCYKWDGLTHTLKYGHKT